MSLYFRTIQDHLPFVRGSHLLPVRQSGVHQIVIQPLPPTIETKKKRVCNLSFYIVEEVVVVFSDDVTVRS